MTVPGGLSALFASVGGVVGDHTFDAVSTYTGLAAADQLNHTCAAGATILVVCITTASFARTGAAPNYNGVALTQVPSSPQDIAETTSEIWYLLDPPTGSSYIVDVDNTGAVELAISASSYISSTGATAFDTDVGSAANPDTNPTSDSITTGADGCVVVNAHGTGYLATPTGNKTLLYSGDFGPRAWGHQYELKATAGSTTFEWTAGAADDATNVVASFKPA